ncbi:hypothetical protein VIBNISO65_680073 [Vibrio nigripulchritudo SO65]|nr:hypothetical protein VIBNIAM115_1530073 [Vibrio nigripulchritudo AM115]CCN40548.1 hypothetical protein VIBNIFTn2_1340010 [Vibrio nigripulchritudo FTn2]CCN66158.1 hypothetical protein VIBNIPon4_50074 [Vibrio nigripulchritudo POn4]CCN78648.1 hypothetical protein VIBNISO65_680073 [Vibrio nigripulchritudo SO65]
MLYIKLHINKQFNIRHQRYGNFVDFPNCVLGAWLTYGNYFVMVSHYSCLEDTGITFRALNPNVTSH